MQNATAGVQLRQWQFNEAVFRLRLRSAAAGLRQHRQIRRRVFALAVFDYFIVQVRAGTAPCAADIGNLLAGFNTVADARD